MSTATIPLPSTYAQTDELPSGDVNNIAKVINACMPIGRLTPFFGRDADVPNGQLVCDGKTIGNVSSGGTARANDDMEDLFAHLWEIGNAEATLAIYTSAGAGSTFGASAAADWAASKRLELPDSRGRVLVGKDNQGGTSANVVTEAEADKTGGTHGTETHTLSTSEIPAHTHNTTFYDNGGGAGSSTTLAGLAASPTSVATDSTGGGGAHENMPPAMFVTHMIWTGVVW